MMGLKGTVGGKRGGGHINRTELQVVHSRLADTIVATHQVSHTDYILWLGRSRLTFTEPKSAVTALARVAWRAICCVLCTSLSRFGPPFYVLRTVTTSPWHTGRAFCPIFARKRSALALSSTCVVLPVVAKGLYTTSVIRRTSCTKKTRMRGIINISTTYNQYPVTHRGVVGVRKNGICSGYKYPSPLRRFFSTGTVFAGRQRKPGSQMPRHAAIPALP